MEHTSEAQQAEITIAPPLSTGEVALMYIALEQYFPTQLKAINARGLNKSLLTLSRAFCTWPVQSTSGFWSYLAWWSGRLCHYKGSGSKPFLVASDDKTRITDLGDSGLAWEKVLHWKDRPAVKLAAQTGCGFSIGAFWDSIRQNYSWPHLVAAPL